MQQHEFQIPIDLSISLPQFNPDSAALYSDFYGSPSQFFLPSFSLLANASSAPAADGRGKKILSLGSPPPWLFPEKKIEGREKENFVQSYATVSEGGGGEMRS